MILTRRYNVMKDIKTKKKVLSGMAAVTKKTASFFGNVSCTWWDYQLKTPKAVKKLRKF